jgi:hypothetical protein
MFIRPKQMPDYFGISERQVRFLMMRGDLKEGLHWQGGSVRTMGAHGLHHISYAHYSGFQKDFILL